MLNNAETLDDLRIPPSNRLEALKGKRAISADTAVRLARYFSTSEKFWMELQADYDLKEVHRNHAA